MDKLDGLAQTTLFAGLNKDDFAALTAHALDKLYPAHVLLAQESGPGDSLYVILSGSVKVYVSHENGDEVILAFLGPGEVFGEMALVDNSRRSASVMTVEPCRLLSISKTAFRECLAKHPDVAFNLIKTLSGRIRLLNENIKSLALLDVYGRIARTLLQLAQPSGPSWVVSQRLTHQDIANMVGSSREMVSRIMKDLERGGYIGMNADKQIVIIEKLPQKY